MYANDVPSGNHRPAAMPQQETVPAAHCRSCWRPNTKNIEHQMARNMTSKRC